MHHCAGLAVDGKSPIEISTLQAYANWLRIASRETLILIPGGGVPWLLQKPAPAFAQVPLPVPMPVLLLVFVLMPAAAFPPAFVHGQCTRNPQLATGL